MKYTRLTKEQFEELHTEFINFLASQIITQLEWATIKKEQPEVAEQELDIFSDLIWEGALTQARYLQNVSSQQLFLFKLESKSMRLIVVKTSEMVDFTSPDGIQWLQKHITTNQVELFTATKDFSADRNQDIFQLIRQGASICEGNLYESLSKLLP